MGIQDISPHNFEITYQKTKPLVGDLVIVFKEKQIFLKENKASRGFINYKDLSLEIRETGEFIYLFSLGGKKSFFS